MLGTLVDHFGATIDEIRSPVNGEIWAVRETPMIRLAELAFMVAE